MSTDNIDDFQHTPNKMLIFIVHVPDCGDIKTSDEYRAFYRDGNFSLTLSDNRYENFGPTVILNDYETFIDKVYHTVKAL